MTLHDPNWSIHSNRYLEQEPGAVTIYIDTNPPTTGAVGYTPFLVGRISGMGSQIVLVPAATLSEAVTLSNGLWDEIHQSNQE
jgi:hypothetical protein